jgi:hypothetical protein
LLQCRPGAQVFPQAPQLLLSLWVSMHAVPHNAVPAGQAQLPPAQMEPAGQALPQVPQLFTSVWVLTQAPPQLVGVLGWQQIVPGCPLAKTPAAQTSPVGQPTGAVPQWHPPPEQVSPGLQALPQPPQFAGSLWVSVQVEPQSVWLGPQPQPPFVQTWPAAQAWPQLPQWLAVFSAVQTPPQQPSPAPHACPQAPQFAVSLDTSVQTPPQQCFPPGQSPLLPQVQAPFTQLSPAAHACPHAPQLAASLVVFTSQPLLAFLSQSAKPARQWKLHVPLTQAAVAFAGMGQTWLQLPQLPVSLVVSTHLLPHSVWPAAQPPLWQRPLTQL